LKENALKGQGYSFFTFIYTPYCNDKAVKFMIQKILIIIGILFVLIGLLFPFLRDIGLGRLPGDIVIKKEKSSFYFPIVTCILVSIVISLILMFLKK
jgi:hypothetical protein